MTSFKYFTNNPMQYIALLIPDQKMLVQILAKI